MILLYDEMVEKVSDIARIAGTEIMYIYTKSKTLKLHIQKKLDQSPVTIADVCANRIIVYLLNHLTPRIPVLSEESLPEWQVCREWDYFWLIDPLDGTKEFLSHNGEFTVNIALIEYGQPVMGVVYIPVYNILYAADNGRVWKVNHYGKRVNISVKTAKYPIVLMSRHNNSCDCNNKKLHSYLVLKKLKNYKIINIGSSVKFCLIAEGSAQFYPRFSKTKIWDTAAGHVIAKTAGALVSDWDGYPLNYKKINRYFLNPGFQVSLF